MKPNSVIDPFDERRSIYYARCDNRRHNAPGNILHGWRGPDRNEEWLAQRDADKHYRQYGHEAYVEEHIHKPPHRGKR